MSSQAQQHTAPNRRINTTDQATCIAQFIDNITATVPSHRIYQDELRRYAYGTDASCYRLIPQAVVKVKSTAEVIVCIKAAAQYHVPITFRAAGTSLSGQAVTDSVLLLIDNSWSQFKILDNGHKIALDPGVIGQHANLYLKPYQRKIGPDPASLQAAKIGGIAANNASGMCCGVVHNSYHTLDSMRIIFSDGQVLDTASQQDREAFINNNADWIQKITALSERIRNDPVLSARITHKYRIKNTTGYGLNALVDFTDSIDIIQHLLIGSEGTLAFIANITYRTVPDVQLHSCCLALFNTLYEACQFALSCQQLPVTAVELMDSASLKTMVGKPGVPAILTEIGSDCAGLLIQVEASKQKQLDSHIAQVHTALSAVTLLADYAVAFSTTLDEYENIWNIRKGIFPVIGSTRKIGTSVIIEDVAVAITQLADLCLDLQQLFQQHGYDDAAIFGHALAGNLHFVFTARFDTDREIKRFDQFITDVVNVVVKKYDGSIKAEHGTGRNMSPFVATEWGDALYQVQKNIKLLFDEKNILNPGVIINNDASAHIKNLKTLPPADALVDQCTECGFCEPVCPAKNVSLTPRQRITVYREIMRLNHQPTLNIHEKSRYIALQQQYTYLGIDTCAATGLCQLTCPVSIDTGQLILKLRQQQQSRLKQQIAQYTAKHFGLCLKLMRCGLRLHQVMRKLLGQFIMQAVYKIIRLLTKVQLNKLAAYLPTALPTAAKTSHKLRSKK